MALPEIITVEDLFGPPVRTSASISPDGERIAYLAPWKNRLNVWVQSAEAGAEARCVTADDNRSVHEYHWTADPRWLVYTQDDDGDENWHLHRVDLDDPHAPVVDLTPFPGATVAQFELSSALPASATLILNNRKVDEFDLYALDVGTGELTLLVENLKEAAAAEDGAEQPGEGPAEAEQAESGGAAQTIRNVIEEAGADYPMGLYPAQVTPDEKEMWMGSNRGTDRTRLVRLDLQTGEEREIDSRPAYDLDTLPMVDVRLPFPLIMRKRTGEVIGARYRGERQVVHALDDHFAAVLENLEKLSDGDLGAVSFDESEQRWVVSFTHDRDPGATYYYDHTTGESRLLFRSYPHLDPDVLAPMTPVTVPARDGRDLPSYLTLPVGVEPTGLPLVLLVHGGPWARDIWEFNPGVQLLANRGYAVLQVNFRGSTGYGKAHVQAAIGEFAGAMHDDLIDAVGWAVGQGYADPDRVGIMGVSYGGYATLVGVTFTPDVFAAAVDIVGVSDLANFIRTIPPYTRSAIDNSWLRFVGDPDDPAQEADMLARSPISHVDRIRTPLMVVQGANDVRVVKAESDRIVESLRSRGVEVDYMVKDNEGHTFRNPENRIDLYQAVDRFFAEHLGGRQQP